MGPIPRLASLRGHLARPVAAFSSSVDLLRLTLDGGPLTLEQREAYERDGFLIIGGIWDGEEARLEAFHAHYLEVCRDSQTFVKGPAATVTSLTRDINVVDGTHDLGELSPEFGVIKLNGFLGRGGREDELFCEGYARSERLRPYIQQLVGSGSLDSFSEMYVCKPPGLDSLSSTLHPLHQDLLYLPRGEREQDGSLSRSQHGYTAGNSALNAIVCAYTAVRKATPDNGCLVAIPGSHQHGLRAHGYPLAAAAEAGSGTAQPQHKNNVGYLEVLGVSEEERSRLVPLALEAGEVVFFHPQLVHGSLVNRMPVGALNSMRAAISCHFVRSDLSRYQPSGAPVWAEVPVGKAVFDIGADPTKAAAAAGGERQAGVELTPKPKWDPKVPGAPGGGGAISGAERRELAEQAAQESIKGTHHLVRE
jgi:phytanoyl-CoA hydroxylase